MTVEIAKSGLTLGPDSLAYAFVDYEEPYGIRIHFSGTG